ncbi:MAG TPA: GAF domain-containing protein [Methylomirabilota bacterium]|nr:GAF domain-containing protein [Methylomirabilota bacterium]
MIGVLRRYLLAVAIAGAAAAFSFPLEPYVDRGDLPLFLGAVMLSAWYGGFGPGLVTTAVGIVLGLFALTAPGMHPTSLSPAAAIRLAIFGVEALVICGLSGALRRAESRARALAESEQQARQSLEAAAHQVRAVQRVTDSALSHLHVDDLLHELLARIKEALSADTVVFLLLTEDGRELQVRAAHGLEEEVAHGIRVPVGRGIAGRIATRGSPMLVDDVAAVEVSSPILRAKGLRSLLGTPLFVDGRVIGVMHVGSFAERGFTPDDIRLLQLVADRIAMAIERARLFEAEEQARNAAEVAERRFRLLVDGVRDYAFYMLDPAGRVESWNAGTERLKGYTTAEILGQPFARFYTPEEARSGAARRMLERATADGRAVEEGWRVRKDGSRFWAEVLVTALRDPDDRLLGYSVLTHDLTERRRAAEVRARLLEQVIAAQEGEQRRIARELHDETGQSLTSLLVGLRALQDVRSLEAARRQAGELREITARTLDEVRRLARGLRPSALDELGLLAAVEQHALEYAQTHGITVDVRDRGLGSARLPVAVETAIYRIIQEALTNASKHAGARSISVVLQRAPDAVQAMVADDGCGFDVDAALRAPAAWSHLGLHGMRERAALVNGTVTIESAPGEGTTIYVRVPVPGARGVGACDDEDPHPPGR